MASAKPKKPPKPKPAPEPADLLRQAAGNYVSGDGRFEVGQSDATRYVVDRQQTNEFGQQLIHGPWGSLKAAKAAIPSSREIEPLLRSARRAPSSKAANAEEKPAAPPSWIDRLPQKEAAEVHRLMRALTDEGVADTEALVKRDRGSPAFALAASALIETRLKKLIADAPEGQRDAVRRAIKTAAEILTDEGAATARPLPRWELVEAPRDPDQPPRRIRLRP